jgi:Fe-S-cluster containining protein
MSEEAVRKTCSFNVCCECKLGCCQDVKPPLTSERREIIEDYLKKKGISPQTVFTRAGYCYPAVDAIGFCVFYDKRTRECLVHQVKPETCRAGPVTFGINLQTRKVEWYLKTAEVCALAKELSGNANRFKEHFQVAEQEILRLICKLDSEDLRAILKIEEPHTLKIREEALPKEVEEKLGLR